MPGVPAGMASSLLIPWHRNMLAGKELAVPSVGMLFPTPWQERVSGRPLLCAHGMGLSHPGIRMLPCQPPRVYPQGLLPDEGGWLLEGAGGARLLLYQEGNPRGSWHWASSALLPPSELLCFGGPLGKASSA